MLNDNRPVWDPEAELRRYQQPKGMSEGRRFARQVEAGFGRSIGWGLGRRLLNLIFGRG